MMTLEVETVVAVSLMMAVFSAVAAVGTSIVLGAGFERLRSGFEVVRKQTGFFSDALHQLEKKVEHVDHQALRFDENMRTLEIKVGNVGEQANIFCESVSKLEQKVSVVDKQTGFFSNAIHKLEQKVEAMDAHGDLLTEKLARHADTDTISTGKTEALVAHAENLLTQVAALAGQMQQQHHKTQAIQDISSTNMDLQIPKNLMHFVHQIPDDQEIRFH